MPKSSNSCDSKRIRQILRKIRKSPDEFLTDENLGGGPPEIGFLIENELIEMPIRDKTSPVPRHKYALSEKGAQFLKGNEVFAETKTPIR